MKECWVCIVEIEEDNKGVFHVDLMRLCAVQYKKY